MRKHINIKIECENMSVISTNIGTPSVKPQQTPDRTPAFMHTDPTSTSIDFDSLLDVINNTAKNPADVYNYDASKQEYVEGR